MKKKFRLLSLALSIIMAVSSSATVFAAEPDVTTPVVSESAISTEGSASTNGFTDGLVGATPIYNNATFSFHTSNYGNAFYARKGYVKIEVKSSAPAGYGDAPLSIDFCRSNRDVVHHGGYHTGTDSWTYTYEVPENGYYCFHYFNGWYYGDSYDFNQKITITASNVYPLTN